MLDGWLVFFRGLGTCQRYKGLWVLILPPIALNFLLFVGLFYLGAEYVTPSFMDVLQGWIGDIPAFVRYLVMGLFIYVFYLFIVYFFNAVGLLIGSFFYTLIAVRFFHHRARESGQGGVDVFQPRLFHILKYELIKFCVLTLGGVILSVLSWFMPYLSFVFLLILVLLLAYEYFDYGFEGLKLSYGERLTWIRKNLWKFFSAGLVVYLLLSIPLIGFLLCPICVVGATDLVYSSGSTGSRPSSQEGQP